MKKLSTSIFVFVSLIFFGENVYSKKVMLIDTTQYDGFQQSVEGYENEFLNPDDIVLEDENLDYGLSVVASGDTLIIVTHGDYYNLDIQTVFYWKGRAYRGFGNGDTTLYPVPSGFNLLNNVYVKFQSCYSAKDPDGSGPEKSNIQKIIDAMGGAGRGHRGEGFENKATGNVKYFINKGSAEQRNDALFFLSNNLKQWIVLPPVNRRPLPFRNHLKEAQRLLNINFGNGVIELDSITYHMPFNTVGSLLHSSFISCECECGFNSRCGCVSAEGIDNTPQDIYFEENFDEEPGDSLHNHGWINSCDTPVNPLIFADSGLTFTGYQYSGIGNSVFINNSGEDVYKDLFLNGTEGSIYVYFMAKIISATSSGDYFAALLPSYGSCDYTGRVYAKSSGGNIAFGISKTGEADGGIFYSNNNYHINTTYLLVLKYTFNTGSFIDDEVSLLVLSPPGLPVFEPAPAVGPLTGTSSDISNIAKFVLRQGTASASPSLLLDGINIKDNWNSAIVNVTASIQGFHNEFTDRLMITDTISGYLRNTFTPYLIIDSAKAILDSSNFEAKLNFKNTLTGNYFIVIKHRNAVETWSKSGGENIYTGVINYYDFTFSSSNSYGDNSVLVGTRYCFYSGDVNQDEIIDLEDLSLIENDAVNFIYGNVTTDLNGDGMVDASDLSIADNNSYNYTAVIKP